MIKTVRLTADVPDNRQVRIELPADVPTGLADITVVVEPHASNGSHTLGELLQSELFGMWGDRTDIDDSVAFARRLRAEAWGRSQ
jgi:hypothetical protein